MDFMSGGNATPPETSKENEATADRAHVTRAAVEETPDGVLYSLMDDSTKCSCSAERCDPCICVESRDGAGDFSSVIGSGRLSGSGPNSLIANSNTGSVLSGIEGVNVNLGDGIDIFSPGTPAVDTVVAGVQPRADSLVSSLPLQLMVGFFGVLLAALFAVRTRSTRRAKKSKASTLGENDIFFEMRPGQGENPVFQSSGIRTESIVGTGDYNPSNTVPVAARSSIANPLFDVAGDEQQHDVTSIFQRFYDPENGSWRRQYFKH